MKKNLLTSLKELLKAYGGENSNKNNAVQIIDEITETLGGEATSKSKNLVEAIDKLSNQVSQSDSGGGIPFPEITVTLNIDHPENATEIEAIVYERIGNRFNTYIKDYSQGEIAPAQSVITGAILPIFNDNSETDYMNYYGFSQESVYVAGDDEYHYKISFSEVVNLRDIDEGGGEFFEVIDPTKPISCTIIATRTNNKQQ